MKKIYAVLVATMFAASSLAQINARELEKVESNKPFANGLLKYQPSTQLPVGKKMDFVAPTAAHYKSPSPQLRMVASESELITKQPEGTLHDNLYGYGEGFMVYYGFVTSSVPDGTITRFVEGNNGEVYLQNAVCTMSPNTWIKGQKTEGDTIQFNFPQKYYSQDVVGDDNKPTGEKNYFYLYRANFDKDLKMLTIDETSQSIKYVLRNDSLIRVDNLDNGAYLGIYTEDGDWTGYADYYQIWSKLKTQASVPPASATKSQYQIDFFNVNGQEDSRVINVAIDGNDLYLGNLIDSTPDIWAKGKIDGDKAVFEGMAYMGVDKKYNMHTFLTGTAKKTVWDDWDMVYVDSFYFDKSITFDYDAEAKTMKTDGMFDINMGVSFFNSLATYNKAQIKPWENVPNSPVDPKMLEFKPYTDKFGFGSFHFWFDKKSVDGNVLDVNNLYYNAYFNGKLFTADPNTYTHITEEMTDIPYTFSDGSFDFVAKSNSHKLYFYMEDVSKVGIQTMYKDGDKVYKSNLVEYEIDENGEFTPIETSINGTTAESNNVTNVSYSDLSGRRVNKLANGVYLKTLKMADGKQKTVKVVVK